MFNWLKKLMNRAVYGVLYLDPAWEVKPKRARTKSGKYKADDKSTKGYNEAWVGGKAPKKKKKAKKKTKKKKDYYGKWEGNL